MWLPTFKTVSSYCIFHSRCSLPVDYGKLCNTMRVDALKPGGTGNGGKAARLTSNCIC